jgi:hypothetical protein
LHLCNNESVKNKKHLRTSKFKKYQNSENV